MLDSTGRRRSGIQPEGVDLICIAIELMLFSIIKQWLQTEQRDLVVHFCRDS